MVTATNKITISLKYKLNGCDVQKICNILSEGTEWGVDGNEWVSYKVENINDLLCELTKLKIVAEE